VTFRLLYLIFDNIRVRRRDRLGGLLREYSQVA
jgi:hypothetical protein